MATTTKAVAPQVLVPKGGFVGGPFVGHYEATVGAPRSDPLTKDARVLDLVVLRGHVKNLRPMPPPSTTGSPPPVYQPTLEVLAEFDDAVPTTPLGKNETRATGRVVHALQLRDAFIVGWTVEPLSDETHAARGIIRGTLVARAGPRPWSWWVWLWLLLLLLLLLFLFLLAAPIPFLAPVADPLRARVQDVVDDVRAAVDERLHPDSDADLVAKATKGAGGGGTGSGAGTGTGTQGGGDGDTGTGKGTGKGTGDDGTGDKGTGGMGNGDSGDNGTGDKGTDDQGAGDDGTGDDGDKGTGDKGTGDKGTGDKGTGDKGTGDTGTGDKGTGDKGTGDTGTGDNGTGDKGTGDKGTGDGVTPPPAVRRYSVQEALEDPGQFFSRCGRPLYLSGDLLFDLDDDALKPAAAAQVRRLARLLRAAPDAERELLITGHADQRGENIYNDALSARRAQRVADALITDGAIEAFRVKVIGRGRREPIVSGNAPAAQQRLNRRVEVIVPCKKNERW